MYDVNVGFIGLGIMGRPMANHLAKSGHHLTVFDINPEPARDLARLLPGQVAIAKSPQEVAAASTVIVTMLPNGRAVEEVTLGERGLVSGMREGTLLLDCSSAEPWLTVATAAALRDHGATMVDAPVSGAERGAIAAELVFMVGAAAADFARVRPLLDVMGRHVFHLGGVGAGHAMKCINNCITAATLAATTEGLLAGRKFGLDPAAMIDVLNLSTGGSWISRTHFKQRIFNRTFDDPFKLALMLKDVGIANELAGRTDVPVPVWALTMQLWAAANRAAGADASVSEFVRWLETRSGTTLERK
jgi:3-hydroxyisobutyrate dehydrogenase-like beta-hydroxyacid dehydrogenase